MIKKILLFCLLPLLCLGQQINTNFGNNGAVITNYANDYDFFGDLLTLPDGKLLLFGNSYVSSNSDLNGFAIIKYNEDGSYDNSFGIRGKVILNFDSYQNSKPNSAILQNDGKILVAGNTANNTRGVITRLLPNGEIDPDFGFNGKMTLESKVVNKILVTPDQKIIILGKTVNDFSIEKLNTDGFYDPTFGTNGITVLDDNNTFEEFTSGEIMNDGSVLCIGNSSNPNFPSNEVVFTKFSANGIFDASFGIKRITMPVNPNATYVNRYARDFKILNNNSLLLLVDGSFMDVQGFGDSRIYKTDLNGNLITSFGNSGYFQFNRCVGCATRLQNLQLLNNQKFIVSLYGEPSSGNQYINNYLFNPDGSLNTGFGTVSIVLGTDFTYIAKTKVSNNKLYTAYNRSDFRNDYYINSYLIDNQFLSTANFEDGTDNSTIYPNPFTESINISFKNIDYQSFKISIYTINGSEIFSADYENTGNTIFSTDKLRNYPTGIYFLKIQSDNYTKTHKIIKK